MYLEIIIISSFELLKRSVFIEFDKNIHHICFLKYVKKKYKLF